MIYLKIKSQATVLVFFYAKSLGKEFLLNIGFSLRRCPHLETPKLQNSPICWPADGIYDI